MEGIKFSENKFLIGHALWHHIWFMKTGLLLKLVIYNICILRNSLGMPRKVYFHGTKLRKKCERNIKSRVVIGFCRFLKIWKTNHNTQFLIPLARNLSAILCRGNKSLKAIIWCKINLLLLFLLNSQTKCMKLIIIDIEKCSLKSDSSG